MTATGALIARHVADLFPTQTSRFDLAQAARRGVIAPLRCIRIPPGPGVRTIAKVPLRRGEVDQDFDQEELAALLDQEPFNVAVADLYQSRFQRVPGVVYTAGVRHANNVAAAFRNAGINAQRGLRRDARSASWPRSSPAFERGEVDVLCNAMLLAEGWNSPRATICMHLAPTASRRVYQQRVGRVTRRNPGKEAGLVIDFVHPATTSDETIVTLHSLLDRDVYRGGAIVVGPVRRGRGRRVRVERRVVPVSADPERRLAVLERELWRIAVENLNYSEQHAWAALAGARVNAANWRRAKAMIQHDQAKELRRRFLLTCLQRNRNQQLRLKALAEVAALREAEAFDDAVEVVAAWPRDDRRAGAQDPAPGARREADRPARPGAGVGLAPGRDHPRAARGVRGPALARDQAPARPVRQLLRPRPRAQRPPHRARRPPAGPAPRGRRCSPPRSRTRPRPRRSCAAPGCAWPASRRPSRASCCGTSRRPAAASGGGGARRAATARPSPPTASPSASASRTSRATRTLRRPNRLPSPTPTTRRPSLRLLTVAGATLVAAGVLAAPLIAAGSATASFTAPVRLNPNAQPGFFPVAGIDGDGDSLVAWRDEGAGQIRARSISATGTLGPRRTLASAPSASVQIATGADGRSVAAWEFFDGVNTRIQARTISPSGVLGPKSYLSPAGIDAFDVRLAIAAGAPAVAIWSRFVGSNPQVQGRTISPAGVRGPIHNLSAAGQLSSALAWRWGPPAAPRSSGSSSTINRSGESRRAWYRPPGRSARFGRSPRRPTAPGPPTSPSTVTASRSSRGQTTPPRRSGHGRSRRRGPSDRCETRCSRDPCRRSRPTPTATRSWSAARRPEALAPG